MTTSAGIAEERWEALLDAIELGKVVPIVGRRLSLCTMCIGVGQGIALIVERV